MYTDGQRWTNAKFNVTRSTIIVLASWKHIHKPFPWFALLSNFENKWLKNSLIVSARKRLGSSLRKNDDKDTFWKEHLNSLTNTTFHVRHAPDVIITLTKHWSRGNSVPWKDKRHRHRGNESKRRRVFLSEKCNSRKQFSLKWAKSFVLLIVALKIAFTGFKLLFWPI